MIPLNLLTWYGKDYGIFYKNDYVVSHGLNETAETDPAVSLRLGNLDFVNDYLALLFEYEAIYKMALAHESGPQGGLFDEKNRGSKIS
jgi:hypothetical protein